MNVDLFDFDLPEDRIALRPVRPRDAARLLVLEPGAALQDRVVRDLPDLLREGDALVVNDTKVIPAELRGERSRGGVSARISVTLLRRLDPSRWQALARPAKRLAAGDHLRFGALSDNACLVAGLDATVEARGEAGEVRLRFELAGVFLDEAIAAIGHMPLPPYIAGRRFEDAADRGDYQTIFAREEGAIAAPTAGLHFTDDLLARLAAKGITRHTVTLHVGAGTFLPVKSADTGDHPMHPEWGTISPATATALNATRAHGGRIVAVGTTSLRLLETAAAAKLLPRAAGEEDHAEHGGGGDSHTAGEGDHAKHGGGGDRHSAGEGDHAQHGGGGANDTGGPIQPFAGETSLFITPGYRFRAVDLLMTNFHLPRSTLFMLAAAFAGRETMLAAYRHAIDTGYRFYSYGDACLLHPEKRR